MIVSVVTAATAKVILNAFRQNYAAFIVSFIRTSRCASARAIALHRLLSNRAALTTAVTGYARTGARGYIFSSSVLG